MSKVRWMWEAFLQLVSLKNKKLSTAYKNEVKKTVLIVDDREEHRLFLKEALESDGFATITCSNAIDALSILRNNDIPVDIVTLDWSMPGMDGDELLDIIRTDVQIENTRKRRNKNFKIPVVMITIFITDKNVEKMKKKADYFLPKPLSYKDVQHVVRNILKKYGDL